MSFTSCVRHVAALLVAAVALTWTASITAPPRENLAASAGTAPALSTVGDLVVHQITGDLRTEAPVVADLPEAVAASVVLVLLAAVAAVLALVVLGRGRELPAFVGRGPPAA